MRSTGYWLLCTIGNKVVSRDWCVSILIVTMIVTLWGSTSCDWCVSILIVTRWVHWLLGTIGITMVSWNWCVSILIVPLSSCSFNDSLSYRAVFLDRKHPRFRNFASTVSVDIVRMESYLDSFLV